MSGGLFGAIGSSVLLGACTSMISNPIEKLFSGEHMTNADYAMDLAVGATIGAATAPIGKNLFLSLLKIVKFYVTLLGFACKTFCKGLTAVANRGAIKCGARLCAGATKGAVGGVINETSKVIINDKDPSFGSYMGATLVGGVVGGTFGVLGKKHH